MDFGYEVSILTFSLKLGWKGKKTLLRFVFWSETDNQETNDEPASAALTFILQVFWRMDGMDTL